MSSPITKIKPKFLINQFETSKTSKGEDASLSSASTKPIQLISTNNNSKQDSNSKLTQKEISQTNEQLIDELYERVNKSIDAKIDSFSKWINILAFKNSARCGKSTKDRKRNVIFNNDLNKLSRLHDLIDVEKYKKKSKIHKNDSQFPNINPPESATSNDETDTIESIRKSKENDYCNNTSQSSSSSFLSEVQTASTIQNIDIQPYKTTNAIDNILPVLSITSEERNNRTSVILTWNLFKINEEKFIEENDPFLSTIKDYEIHGYREESEKLKNDGDIPFTFIGNVKPKYFPPIKCTLTDFMKGSNYLFGIRVRDKNNDLSQISKPVKIKL